MSNILNKFTKLKRKEDIRSNEERSKDALDALNLYQEGRLEAAAKKILKTCQDDPDHFYNWFARGNIMVKLDTDDAEQSFKRALHLRKTDSASYNNLGLLYFQRGDIQKARNYFLMASSVDPVCVEVMLNIANCERSDGNFENAEKLLIRILELKPEYLNARINLAAVLSEQHRYLSALGVMDDVINNYIKDVPSNIRSTAWQNYGYCLAQCGMTHEAHYAALTALEHDPYNHFAASNALLDLHYNELNKEYIFELHKKVARVTFQIPMGVGEETA